VQVKSFETEVQHLWDILETLYQEAKHIFRVNDFEDLAGKKKASIRKNIKEKSGEPVYEDVAKVWDEISFIKTGETEVERTNRTYIYEKDKIRQKIILMRNRMKQMYTYQYPVERRVMEDRLSFLEREYFSFEYTINPYHLNPGILLDVDITSIKRKKATLDAMANVLNEFLSGVSKGFADAAFASFSRRRSTVREDISQTFGADPEEKGEEETARSPASAYLDLINSDSPASTEADAPRALEAPKGAGKAKAGVVDAKPAAKKSGGSKRPAKAGGDGLKEI
jgi:hypothetical protein